MCIDAYWLSSKFPVIFIAFGRIFCPAWLIPGPHDKIYSILTHVGNFFKPPTRFALHVQIMFTNHWSQHLESEIALNFHSKQDSQHFRLHVTGYRSFIKPSSFPPHCRMLICINIISHCFLVDPETILGTLGMRSEYIPGWNGSFSQGTMQTHFHTFIHTTLKSSLAHSVHLLACFGEVGGNWYEQGRTRRTPYSRSEWSSRKK